MQKKGGNVKTIPPYKPVINEAGSSDPPSSPEKESETLPSHHHNTASTSASLKSIANTPIIVNPNMSSSKQRKSTGNSKATSTNIPLNAPATASPPVINPIVASNIIGSGVKLTTGSVKEKDNKHKNITKIANSSKGHEKDSRDKAKSKGSNKDSAANEQSAAAVTVFGE